MRWETLNAYVDGELDPGERRAVLDAARADPEIAARIETLSRLKGIVRGSVVPERRPNRQAGWNAGLGLAFASAALCVGLAVLPPRPAAPVDPAVAAFDAWSESPDTLQAADALRASSTEDVLAPDLTGVGLTLIGRVPAAQGWLLAYEGAHGCRLALWSGEASIGETPDRAGAGPQVLRWRVGTRRHAMLSRGMDANRFAGIASAVEAFTRGGDPDRVRLALVEIAHAGLRPCAA